MSDNEYQAEYQSETEDSPLLENGVAPNPHGQPPPRQMFQPPRPNNQQMIPGAQTGGRQYGVGQDVRTYPIRESRIKDRPAPKELKDSSLKIKIELDLEVEVDLYARVKGDVTIGLM